MSIDTKKLSSERQDELNENIRQVQGVLELLFCALSSEHPINQERGVWAVIMDAQQRMKSVEEAVDVLTAA